MTRGRMEMKWFIIFVLLLGIVCSEEKDLGTLIKGLKSGDDATRKDSLKGLEKRAGYSEYSVKEIEKRGAVPLLLKILQEENSNPLVKELVVATLSKMTKHSHQVGISLLDSSFMSACPTLMRRGTTTAQEHTVTILTNIAKIGPAQRANIAGTPALEAAVYVLKSGTPQARENAANLISALSQDPTARLRFAEFDVENLLTKVTVSGTTGGKKVAAAALQQLRQPIVSQPAQSTSSFSVNKQATKQAASAATFKTAKAATVSSITPDPQYEHLHQQPPQQQHVKLDLNFVPSKEIPEGPPKQQKGFVNNYRLRARSSHM